MRGLNRKKGVLKFLVMWLVFFVSLFLVFFKGFNGGILVSAFIGLMFSLVPASILTTWKWGFKDFWQCQNCKNGNHESCTNPYEPIAYGDAIWHCCCVVDEINKETLKPGFLRLTPFSQTMKWRDGRLHLTPPFPSHYTINKRTCSECQLGNHQECHSPDFRVDDFGHDAWTCCCNMPIDGVMWMGKKLQAERESADAFEKWERAMAEKAEEQRRQNDIQPGGSW